MINSKEFQFQCQTEEIIKCDVKTVYQSLFNLRDWPSLLPHVRAVEVLYDDGCYQEFTMEVISETDAGTLSVRSVRRCTSNDYRIEFFQPEPPSFLIHHAGGWNFDSEDNERACRVLTFHQWNLNYEEAKKMFKCTDNICEQRVYELLIGHASFALTNWKRILESRLVSTKEQS